MPFYLGTSDGADNRVRSTCHVGQLLQLEGLLIMSSTGYHACVGLAARDLPLFSQDSSLRSSSSFSLTPLFKRNGKCSLSSVFSAYPTRLSSSSNLYRPRTYPHRRLLRVLVPVASRRLADATGYANRNINGLTG